MVFGAIAGLAAKAIPMAVKGAGAAVKAAGGVGGVMEKVGGLVQGAGGGGGGEQAEGAGEGKAARGGGKEAKAAKEDKAIDRLLQQIDGANGPQDLKRIVDGIKAKIKDPEDQKKLGQKIATKLGGKAGPDGSVRLELTPQVQQTLQMLGIQPDQTEGGGGQKAGAAGAGGAAPPGGAHGNAPPVGQAAPKKAA